MSPGGIRLSCNSWVSANTGEADDGFRDVHAFRSGDRVGLFPIQHLPELQDQFVRNERFLNEGNSLPLNTVPDDNLLGVSGIKST